MIKRSECRIVYTCITFIMLYVFNSMCPMQCIYAKTEVKTTDLYRDIDTYLQSSVKNANIPSMSITIVDKDKVLFSQSYGGCENCDTPYLLGSVSKSFTAACIMQLSEQGKLDLDAYISDYLPEAQDGSKITVSQLLNHTSGLGEHQTLENYKLINKQGVHHYANVNYSLLGEIIEKVSGKAYNEYVTENIFQPLSLSHTAATLDESEKNGVIGGYTNLWGIPVKNSHKYSSSKNAWITVPAGYISSSVNDLGKYLQMYLNDGNDILSKESIDTMFYGDTVYVDGDVPYWYGYGWATVKEPLYEPVLRHSGLIETGTSCVFILPESSIAIALTTNVNDYFVTNHMVDEMGWGIVLMILGEPPNDISDHAYLLSHIQIDLVMLAVFMAAILPLCLFPKYVKKIKGKRRSLCVLSLIMVHFFLPVFILLLVPIFFKTPLWVAQAFVPDVFVTVVISSALLFAGGVVKGVFLYKNRKKAA